MQKLNLDNFEQVADREKGLFMIRFFSDTCGPCKSMEPVLEAFEKKNSKLPLYEVNSMESPDLVDHFGVRGVPTMIFCEKRHVLYQFTGLTSLVDLQYVVDHINDPYFRKNGEFKKADKKTDWTFYGVIAGICILFLVLFLTS
jgi:thioredoxin 1